MLNSPMIDVALGLVFIFAVVTALSSTITELIARFLGLRARYLLQGLRELLDSKSAPATALSQVKQDYEAVTNFLASNKGSKPGGSMTGALLGSPFLTNQGMVGTVADCSLTIESAKTIREESNSKPESKSLRAQLRGLPSYIPARSFAYAVVGLLVPNTQGHTTMDAIENSISHLKTSLPESPFVLSLATLAKAADGKLDVFEKSVEQWYDDHMSRVSGWYKRHVAKITLIIGAILVVGLNLNTLMIGRTLYTDNDVRSAVSSFAARTAACPVGQDQESCLKNLASELSGAASVGLPIGWVTVSDCAPSHSGCNLLDRLGIFSRSGGSIWKVLLVVGGILLTVIALVPGSRFWFDVLGKLGTLRSSGPKPPAAPAS